MTIYEYNHGYSLPFLFYVIKYMYIDYRIYTFDVAIFLININFNWGFKKYGLNKSDYLYM